MADNKNSFVLYTEYIEIFEELSDEDAGQLVKHLFRYVNDKDPKTENPFAKLAFIPIKQQLKRDLKKYESICERNSKNGAKGGRPEKPKKPTGLTGLKNKPKKADNEDEHDNDNEHDNTSDDVLKNIDDLFKTYLGNHKLINALIDGGKFKTSENVSEKLTAFNLHLKEQGQFMKTWKDYTSHFLNWHKKSPKGYSPTDKMQVI